MKLGKAFLFSILTSCFSVFLFTIPVTETFGTTHTISFGGTSFSPSSLNVSTGDTIVWSGAFAYHYIQSTSVPSGAPTFGATDANTTSLSYVVSVAGTYNYQCNIHYAMGMTGSFTATAPAVKAFTLSTTTVDFGSLRVNSTMNKTVTLTSTGPDAALTISSSPLSVGTMYSTSPTGTNRTVNVNSTETETITFKPTSRGALYDTLTINNNATTTTDQVKKIFISGTGINGVFSGAASIAFDKVRVGNSSQLTYTITNSGDDTLFLSAPSISGSGFTLVSGSAQNIIVGGTASVVIKFAPSVKQAYTGSLTMTAQNNVTVPSISISGTGIAPIISLTPASSYDMGSTYVGGVIPGDIQVKNTGDDDLHVTGVSIPNTQQGAKFTLTSNTSFTLAPAASTDIVFSYTSASESTDNATLVLSCDDPVASSKQVSLTARSGLPKMSVDTKDTIDFGSVRLNTPANAFLSITNLGTYDLAIQINGFVPDVFSLSSVSSSVPPQGTIQATFIFTPTAEGIVTGRGVLHSSDNSNSNDTIYFKGIGINTALDFPASVDFHQLNLSKTRDSVLRLKNFGTAGAKIIRYSLTDLNSGFVLVDTSAHAITANDSVTIRVRFAPSKEIAYAATLNIVTDDGAAPNRKIALAGSGINSKLSTSTSAIDFGVLDTGNTSTKTFSLTNTGSASTTITSLKTGGDPSFTLGTVSLPLQIDASASKDISVTFSPKAAGSFDGTVTITASEGSPLSVSLHGKGHVTIVVGSVANILHDIGLKLILYPNPNNGSATIKLNLEKPLNITLALFDATGKLVQDYKQTSFNAGEYTLPLTSETLPSGEYYLRAISGGATAAELKVLIVR